MQIQLVTFKNVQLAPSLRIISQLPYMETCELQSIHSHPGMTGLTLE